MSPKMLEKKIDRMAKDLAFIKRLVLADVKKAGKRVKKEVLTDWAIRQIKLGQADVRAGRVHSLEQVKKMIGLK